MSVSPLTEDSIKGMLTRNDLGRPVIQVAGMICVHMHDTSLATSANKDVVGWCLKVSDGKYTHPAWLHSSLIPHITSGKLTNRAIIKVAYRSHPPIKVWRWGNELCITLTIKDLEITHCGHVGKNIGFPIPLPVADHGSSSTIEKAQPIGGSPSTSSSISIPRSLPGKVVLKRPQSVQSPDTTTETAPPPPQPQGSVAKRPRTEVENNAPAGAAAALNNPIQPSTSAAAKQSPVIAVCSQAYPLNLLTTEQISAVTIAIMDKIVENKDGKFKPQFTSSVRKAGYLSITCKDELTRLWLVKIVPTLVPWEGARLYVLNGDALSRPILAMAIITNDANYDSPRIMRLLAGQNDHYNFKAWRCLRGWIRVKTVTIVWAIDQRSADLLKENHNKLFFALGTIKVDLKSVDQADPVEIFREIVKYEATLNGL